MEAGHSSLYLITLIISLHFLSSTRQNLVTPSWVLQIYRCYYKWETKFFFNRFSYALHVLLSKRSYFHRFYCNESIFKTIQQRPENVSSFDKNVLICIVLLCLMVRSHLPFVTSVGAVDIQINVRLQYFAETFFELRCFRNAHQKFITVIYCY